MNSCDSYEINALSCNLASDINVRVIDMWNVILIKLTLLEVMKWRLWDVSLNGLCVRNRVKWGGRMGEGCVCMHACIEKALNGGTDNEVLIPECIWGMLLNSGVLLSNIAND